MTLRKCQLKIYTAHKLLALSALDLSGANFPTKGTHKAELVFCSRVRTKHALMRDDES